MCSCISASGTVNQRQIGSRMRRGSVAGSCSESRENLAARQRTHAPRRVSARGRGVWTPAEASVECSVMSGATATSADDASHAEQREGAGGGDGVGKAVKGH